MDNPRAEKVAVVDEVKAKFEGADAVVLTEYRGLKVSELAELRRSMRAAGGEYKVYKNTLVRFAARSLELELDDQLTGPTGLAFVSTTPDGGPGDIATVAKVIADFAKGNPLLVIKGGFLGDNVIDAAGAKALASLPTASEIYARIAGGLNSGARGLAGAISGVHRSVAYVLQAAIDAGAFAGDAPVAPSEAPAAEEPSAEAAASEEPSPVDEVSAPEAIAEVEAPEAEAAAPEAATENPESENAEEATETEES